MQQPGTTLKLRELRETRAALDFDRLHFSSGTMTPEKFGSPIRPAKAKFMYSPESRPLDGYTIGRGIGVGGFGEVYFAISDAGKEVALKRIQRNLDIELRGVQNCINLKHINLIALWDIRTDAQGECWVVMEYVPGPSLRDIIEVNESGMPDHQIQRWFDSIASGVKYLHDAGLVHRDLKPANIFLDEDEGVIKIGDYGLSKLISSSQRSGQTETVGTFHYMAPEIGKGIYGKGVDIYAMGVVLFEMLTGAVPFTGESSHEIIMKHLTADPDLSAVPTEYQEVIRRSLLKDPEQRFRCISEVREYLPWKGTRNGQLPRLTDQPRFEQVDFVRRNNSSNGVEQSRTRVTEVFQRSAYERGILFGPLIDSSAGGTPSNNNTSHNERSEIVFLDEAANTRLNSQPIQTGKSDLSPVASTNVWAAMMDWWRDASISTPVKVVIILALGFFVAINSHWLFLLAMTLGLVYLVYFGVRNVILQPVELHPDKLTQRQEHQKFVSQIRSQITSEDWITKTTTLVGAFLVASIVCIALCLLGLAVVESMFAWQIQSWATFAWAATISILSSWGLLIIGNWIRSDEGGWLQRRFAMLVFGSLVGGLSLFFADFYGVDFSNERYQRFNPLDSTVLVFQNRSLFAMHVLFFAGVFSVLRWWKSVDPVRRSKLSLWSIGLCLVWAVVFGYLLDFTPLLASFLVVIVSIAVQLSAPWFNKEQCLAMVSPVSK